METRTEFAMLRLLERIADALDAMSPENQIGTMVKHLPLVLREVEKEVRKVQRREAAKAALQRRKALARKRAKRPAKSFKES